MVQFFATWWPIMVLLALPQLVHRLVWGLLTRAFLRLDKSHPDDLPQTAGDWLADELKRIRMDWKVTTMVTDKDARFSLDAYHPLENVIQLSAETHFKRDPMHWAIAAHELGHARFRHAMPRFARFTLIASFGVKMIKWVACGLLVGNVAFALPHVTNAAFLLFAIMATLALVRLVDEIAASLYAMQSLRKSPVFAWSHLRNARILLVLAFSTYLVSFVANTLLLTQWHYAEELTRTPIVPPLAHLTGFGLVVAVLTSIILLVQPIVKLVDHMRPRTRTSHEDARHKFTRGLLTLAWMVAMPLFVWLVYNTRADTNWAYLVMAALVTAHGYFLIVLWVPYLVADVVVLGRLFKKLVVDHTHRSPEFVRDHAAGSHQRRRGNITLEGIIERLNLSPPTEYRLSKLMNLCYLPLVIAFWLS